jgi:hypothetical protein
MKPRLFYIIIICALCINGCATHGDILIINSYSDKEKSVLLSDKGIQLYNVMIGKGDLALVPSIKNFLQESLKLYPGNENAGIYLQKSEEYNRAAITKSIKIAKRYLSKKSERTENDNYDLCLTLQKAHQIDPTNDEVINLLEKTSDVREKLAEKMLVDGDVQLEVIGKIGNCIIQGKAIIPIIEKYDEMLILDSSQADKLTEKRSCFLNLLSGDMDSIIVETKMLTGKSKYHDAELRLKILNNYNRYANHHYDDLLKSLQYDLYFNWSKRLCDSNQIDLASEKIHLALKSMKTHEALALEVVIQNNKSKVDATASFDNRISEIDVLLEQKEIALAYQKINALKVMTKTKAKLQALENRKAKAHALLEIVYNDAATDFVNENYSSAVKGLENILAVTRNYKDARSYLKKSKSELKILALY